jgi:hypothetical protein
MQRTLMDRRRVYDLLEESGIDVPRHVFMSRDGYASTGTGDGNRHDRHGGGGSDADGVGSARPRASSFAAGFEPEVDEHDDHIEVNGVIINKPFVEKPVDADDHNIAIYYPSSAGGGCKKLFRKVGDRSSEFYPEINEIRRDGSYIYETFMETQGTDVKVRAYAKRAPPERRSHSTLWKDTVFCWSSLPVIFCGTKRSERWKFVDFVVSLWVCSRLRRFFINSFLYFSPNISLSSSDVHRWT